ncbi:MAG: hypothetical protein ACRED3_07775 [Bradyrhizobium sp.]
MKTFSQAEAPLSQLVLTWTTDRISHALAAIKPKHGASQIAADIAAGGNPTGA